MFGFSPALLIQWAQAAVAMSCSADDMDPIPLVRARCCCWSSAADGSVGSNRCGWYVRHSCSGNSLHRWRCSMTLAFSLDVHSVAQCLQVTRGWRLPDSSSRARLTSSQQSSLPRGMLWFRAVACYMGRLAIGFDEMYRPRCRWVMLAVDLVECSWKRQDQESRLNGGASRCT